MRFISTALLSVSILAATPAAAQQQQMRLTVQSGSLKRALSDLARQAGISVGYVGMLPETRVKGFSARLDARLALEKIVANAPILVRQVGPRTFRLEPRAAIKRPSVKMPIQERASSADKEFDVQDIIVTASKREAEVFSLPISLATYDLDTPSSRTGLTSTADVVRGTTGLTSTNMGPGLNRLFIRGVADGPFNGPSQATVGIFLNDARVNFDTPDPDLKLVDVQRVEVIKGPQGALYGTGALGGVYRIIARKAEFGDAYSLGMTELGTTQNGGVNMAASAVANAPLTSNLATRLIGYAERASGWIDDHGRTRKNVNDVSTYGARAHFRWQPEVFEINALLNFQTTTAKDSQYADENLGIYVRATNFAEPHENDYYGGQINIARPLGSVKAVFTSSFTHHHLAAKFDATKAAPQLMQPGSLLYNEVRGQDITANEVRLVDDSGNLQWLVGAKYLSAQSDLTWGLNGPEQSASSDAYDKSYQEYAVFGDLSFALTKTIRLMAGARLFHVGSRESESVTDDQVHTRYWKINPSASLSWRPSANSHIWFSYSTGTRPGGLNPSASEQPFSFRSDSLASMEIGFRRRGVFRKLEVEGAIYRFNWKDIQSDVLLSSGLVGTLNVGRAHNTGIEFLARWNGQTIFLEGGVTIQFGDLYSSNTFLGNIEDARLPTIPKYRGHGKLAVYLPFISPESRFGISFDYTGSTHLSFDPRLDRQTRPYSNADVFFETKIKEMKWALTCSNVLNTKADSFAYGNPFSVQSIRQSTPIRPRTITLRAEWAF